jgi:hypothetical protein
VKSQIDNRRFCTCAQRARAATLAEVGWAAARADQATRVEGSTRLRATERDNGVRSVVAHLFGAWAHRKT